MIRKIFSLLTILLLPCFAYCDYVTFTPSACPGNTSCLYGGSIGNIKCNFWTYCCLTDPANGPALCTAAHVPGIPVFGKDYWAEDPGPRGGSFTTVCGISKSDLDAQIQISKNFCSSYVAPGLPANIYFTHGFLAPYDYVFATEKDINGKDIVQGGTVGADTYNSQTFSS